LRRNPQFEHTLIIAQTGWGQDRDREMAIFAGINHHFVKPLKPEDITNLLAKVVPG
jgi:CheY-like chemotaxis protein